MSGGVLVAGLQVKCVTDEGIYCSPLLSLIGSQGKSDSTETYTNVTSYGFLRN